MNKLLALLSLFRKGSAVADPALWKNGGAALQAALVPFLLALVAVLRLFGVAVDLSAESAAAIAGGLVALVGVLVTYLSSDKVGLPAESASMGGAVGDGAARRESPSVAPVGSKPADAVAAREVRPQPGAPDDPSNYLPG